MTVQRWKCTSYCLCGSRKGHFEKSDDEGVWVRYEAAHALEQENERLKHALERCAEYAKYPVDGADIGRKVRLGGVADVCAIALRGPLPQSGEQT